MARRGRPSQIAQRIQVGLYTNEMASLLAEAKQLAAGAYRPTSLEERIEKKREEIQNTNDAIWRAQAWRNLLCDELLKLMKMNEGRDESSEVKVA